MIAQWRVNTILLGALAGLVTSCASPEKKADSPSAGASAPPALETIGERAQQIVMATADGNWPQAQACVKDLCAAWQAYRYPTAAPVSYPQPPASLFRGPLEGAMFRLRFAAGKGQATETMKAAQEVDAAALKMFEYYLSTPLLDLRRLRMLEGRIVLHTTQRKMNLASDTFNEVRSAWEGMRPTMAELSPDVRAAFEDSLSAQQTALNKYDREALATCARQAIATINGMLQLSSQSK